MAFKFTADVFAWFPDGEVKQMSPGNGVYYQACIHPMGSDVLYAGAAGGPPRIWRTGLKDRKTTPLTPVESGARHPVFAKDGSKVVYTSDRDSGEPSQIVEEMGPGWGSMPRQGNIFLLDCETGEELKLTNGVCCDQRPCFDPTGTKVVFVSNRTGQNALWSVPVDGNALPEPLAYTGPAYRPWFSLDGEWLYFFRTIDNCDRIRRVRFAGAEDEPVLNDDRGNSHGPFVDPGGDALLMHSTREDGHYAIYELPLDGTTPRRMDPPGFPSALHASRSENGIVAFDVIHPGLRK